jgi:hypothetical protein
MGFNDRKGIVLKETAGKQLLLIHVETLTGYLKDMPTNEAGWIAFQVQKVASKNKSHEVVPLDDFRNRQTKIDGPTQFKKAG